MQMEKMYYIIFGTVAVVLLFILALYLYHKDEKNDFVKPIDSKTYERFILLKDTNPGYIIRMIEEFGQLSGNEEYVYYDFGIAKEKNWYVVKLGTDVDFYTYHNLIGWLEGYEEVDGSPELSCGFAKSEVEENYVAFRDSENEYGDTLVGGFENGKSFFIYLPEAYKEKGNLTITENIDVSMKDEIKYFKEEGLDIKRLESLNFEKHSIKFNL